jgi:hypothetical protein
MEFVGQTADGRSVHYVDKKRHLWLLSLTGGFNPPIAIGLYFVTGHNPLTMLFPLLYTFVAIPIVDALMGEDHHANALRPYQTLRDFEELPRLPSGYPGSFALAAFPPRWFKVMDPKLLRWADGDISKLNVDPGQRDRLYAKFADSH